VNKIKYWAKRLRVRRARHASFAAKYRYWKERWRKLRRTRDLTARKHAAKMVRHYADLVDVTADLIDRAERGLKRARTAEEERREKREGQLSEHFHVSEFACKDGTPVPREAYDALRSLCVNYLEPLRSKFGRAGVTSGYRHAAYNARIGGASLSYHNYDLRSGREVAADVHFERGTPGEWAAYARSLADKRGRGGVGQYNNSGFVHCDNGPRRNWRG